MTSLTSVMQASLVCQFIPLQPVQALFAGAAQSCALLVRQPRLAESASVCGRVAWPALAFGCVKRNDWGDGEERVNADIV